MPRDPKSAEVDAWLTRSRQDLRAAEVDLAADPPLLADAAFHCQQAAEKALKGLLTQRDVPFTKTHDIRALGRQLGPLADKELEDVVRRSSVLTEYAWAFRYPGDVLEPPLDEVRESLALAREVVRAVEERLGR